MKRKYLNDAIIGNRKMIASLSSKGELLRLSYPTADYRQFIDYYLIAHSLLCLPYHLFFLLINLIYL